MEHRKSVWYIIVMVCTLHNIIMMSVVSLPFWEYWNKIAA